MAFLNPHRPDCGFAIQGARRRAAWRCQHGAAPCAPSSAASSISRSWLDLVAIGTIADVAPLDGDNRRARARRAHARSARRRGRACVFCSS